LKPINYVDLGVFFIFRDLKIASALIHNIRVTFLMNILASTAVISSSVTDQRVQVQLLDLDGKPEHGRQPDYYSGEKLFVDAGLAAGALNDFVAFD
jgi:hypothetical protein